MLYGPHEDPRRLVPSVVCSLLRRQVVKCTHGRQVRDLLHVEDVGEAFAALVDSRVSGPVNVASGQGVAIKDVVELIASKLGRPELVRLGEIPVAAGDPPMLVGDNTRLKEEALWKAKYSLAEGIEQTIEWWKTQAMKYKELGCQIS